MNTIQLAQLIKSTGKYDLTIFSPESIDRIEQNTFKKSDKFFIKCLKRNNSGKDNSGQEIYELDGSGVRKLDDHNHLIQKHDLKDIALAFEDWSRGQKLNFWK